MGTIQHNSVIAVTSDNVELRRVIDWIVKRPDGGYFIIGTPKINNTATICLVPDGSNEGWGDSNKGDIRRKEFIEQLNSHWQYIEIDFGELGVTIRKTNCV